MPYLIRGIFFLALMVALFPGPIAVWSQSTAASPDTVLTLERAVQLALIHNLRVKNAALEVDKTSDRVAVARTRRLPKLTFEVHGRHHLTREGYTFEQGVFGDFPSTGPIPPEDVSIDTNDGFTTSVTASLTQPLSHLYRIGLGIKHMQVTEKMILQELRAQQQTTANDVKQIYYKILQVENARTSTEETLTFLRELDREVTNDVKQGKALTADSLEIQARLAKEEHKALVQRNTLASHQERLNHLLGRDINTPFRVHPVPDLAFSEVDLAAAQALAMTQRPEIKETELKVQKSKYAKKITQSEYIPELSFTIRYSSIFGVEFVPRDVATVGLLLRWEFFDWGRKQHKLDEDLKAILQADNDVRQAKSQVALEVNNRLRKLQEAQALMRADQLAQVAAREHLRVVRNEYDQDVVLLRDLLQAQASMSDANNRYERALLDFWEARANLEKALGEI